MTKQTCTRPTTLAIFLLCIGLLASACSGSNDDGDLGGADTDTDAPVVDNDDGDAPAAGQSVLSEDQAIDMARATATSEGRTLEGFEPETNLVEGFWTVTFVSPDGSQTYNVDIAPDGSLVSISTSGG